jgi:hypothetical protein
MIDAYEVTDEELQVAKDEAARAAGDRASFGRPVSGAVGALRIAKC